MGDTHARRPRGGADPLEAAIEALLATGPRRADQLAQETGYSLAATRLRLDRLLEGGRVHRAKANLDQPRWQYLWLPGPAPASAPAAASAGAEEADVDDDPFVPRQATVRSYPPVGRRDPLVAALFGTARGR
jgi:hypothetical protein